MRTLARKLAEGGTTTAGVWERARPPRHGSDPDVTGLLAEAFARAAQTDEVRADVSPERLAQTLLAALVAAGAAATAAHEARPADLEEPLRQAAELVLDGARKRHERVRVRARTTGPVATI